MTRLQHPGTPHRRHRTAASALAAATLTLAVLAALVAISPPAALAFGLGSTAIRAESDRVETVQWVWPVPPPVRVVSPFRAPPTPYTSGHRGVDLEVEPGAPLVAAESGVVSFAGMVAGRGVVAVDHGDGVVSAIEPIDPSVGAGDTVAAGTAIGIASQGGHCAGDCVHFGVRFDGEYVSPFLFLGGLPRAVLLPFG
ncbi:M23 family metallopeptidase [Agromyces italicus]|uniref:M23 family metallopeptidase n=1 Tax=Agromyces italicus TaxID=279572 RepID=UPI0004250DD7|nr:M23 family metallopeptidase [Agromyces italicus]